MSWIFFGVKVETVKPIGGRWFFAAIGGLKGGVKGFSQIVKIAFKATKGGGSVKLISTKLTNLCHDDWPNHTDDGIYLNPGYLDTLDNPIGPP